MVMKSARPSSYSLLASIWRLCVLIAFLAMFLLGWEHIQMQAFDANFDLCRLTTGLGCREAVFHPWARIAFLPAPFWALVVYVVLFLIGPERWRNIAHRQLAAVVVGFLSLVSLVFVVVMVRDLSSPCPLCLLAHAMHFSLAVLTVLLFRQGVPEHFSGGAAPFSSGIWALPLLVLVGGYILSFWAMQQEDTARLKSILTGEAMTSVILNTGVDRFYPAAPEQLIAGNPKAKIRLTIIGSLSCVHCRKVISEIYELPPRLLNQIGVEFVPFPLAAACNPRANAAAGRHPEQCRLAEDVLNAQRHGNFRNFFVEVSRAPGLAQRRFDNFPDAAGTLGPQLLEQIRQVNAIPVTAIPCLLWDGQKLPSELNALAVQPLLEFLLEVRKGNMRIDKKSDECNTC